MRYETELLPTTAYVKADAAADRRLQHAPADAASSPCKPVPTGASRNRLRIPRVLEQQRRQVQLLDQPFECKITVAKHLFSPTGKSQCGLDAYGRSEIVRREALIDSIVGDVRVLDEERPAAVRQANDVRAVKVQWCSILLPLISVA
jgi:hypothetical protein